MKLEGVGDLGTLFPREHLTAAMPVRVDRLPQTDKDPQRTERVIKIYKDIFFILPFFIFLRKKLVLIT